MGLLGVIGNQLTKRLRLEPEKHEKIRILAEAKLDMSIDMTFKTLIDNNISYEEYSTMLNELKNTANEKN